MGRGRVAIVGSINADFVVRIPHLPKPGETVAGGRSERRGGGKGANQAVAAARFGADVRFVGAVGSDDVGVELRQQLEAEGIDVSGLRSISSAPSGVAVILVDDFGENMIAVSLGANDELGATAVNDGLERAQLAVDDVCVVGGFEIPDEAIAAAAKYARSSRVRLVVSPAPAREIAPDVAREMFAASPILTPNEGEAMALARKTNVKAAARELASRTRAPVVVTLGARGALVVDGRKQDEFPGHRVRVVDTTGAGDTFTGALVAELARGAELRECVRYALAAAALSVTVAGARGGIPNRRTVETFIRDEP